VTVYKFGDAADHLIRPNAPPPQRLTRTKKEDNNPPVNTRKVSAMSQSAEASAETLTHASTTALPHRQEAFARHVAAGRTLTDAARLAGYAWDSARQTGSRLMKEPRIAARVASIAHANDNQRQSELDELVSALKRLMIDTMARKNDFAALRAIDMIARLRGLVPTTAKRSDGITAALEEMRQQQQAEDEEADPAPASPVTPEVVFDPPMPPELSAPVEPAPAPEPEPSSPAQARAATTEAARAAVRRRLFCYEHLMAQHPELSGKIHDLSDALAYFDDADNLLPKELWPDSADSGNHPDHYDGNSPD
jgi:phage terminase small subunit